MLHHDIMLWSFVFAVTQQQYFTSLLFTSFYNILQTFTITFYLVHRVVETFLAKNIYSPLSPTTWLPLVQLEIFIDQGAKHLFTFKIFQSIVQSWRTVWSSIVPKQAFVRTPTFVKAEPILHGEFRYIPSRRLPILTTTL